MRIILFFIILSFLTLDSKAQIKKDTLFFKFDEEYILNAKDNSGNYILYDSNDIGTFYFERSDSIKNLKPKDILCLKEYVRSSKFFRKGWKRELSDYQLSNYFDSYYIFLIKESKNDSIFIEVFPRYEIE